MRIGMIGLGRMGGSMTERLLARRHEVVALDTDRARIASAASAPASKPMWWSGPATRWSP